VSTPATRPLRAAVFASGSGSNFQALLDAESEGASTHPWRTVLLVADRDTAGALARAEAADVATRVIRVSGRDPVEVESDTLAALAEAEVEIIFLAGYLRLIPAGVISSYRRRILNIHPALLPAFGGKGMWGRHVHEAVLASGARVSGPTVHYADEAYDEGSIVAQWPVPVRPGDTPELLAARVLAVEHRLYPAAAAHICNALQRGEEPGPWDPGSDAFVTPHTT
jgi:formyltetrahydrofolate-dependent phosphoribosylglycinamide formyltransferase